MSETLTTRQKVAMMAALGTGVMMGAVGLVVYQRLCQNVGLKVTGSDFSQEIATLTTHIQRLRQDIDSLKGVVNVPLNQGEFLPQSGVNGVKHCLLLLFRPDRGHQGACPEVRAEEELQVPGRVRGGGRGRCWPAGSSDHLHDLHQLQLETPEEPELGLRSDGRFRLQHRDGVLQCRL